MPGPLALGPLALSASPAFSKYVLPFLAAYAGYEGIGEVFDALFGDEADIERARTARQKRVAANEAMTLSALAESERGAQRMEDIGRVPEEFENLMRVLMELEGEALGPGPTGTVDAMLGALRGGEEMPNDGAAMLGMLTGVAPNRWKAAKEGGNTTAMIMG